MTLGIQTKDYRFYLKKYFISLYVPHIKLGLFADKDNDDSKWFGLRLNIKNEISFEVYDYGKVFTFIICGIGLNITKTIL